MIEQVLTMKRTAALCLVGAFCSLNAQAQNIQVKGNLVDGTGEPLIGATVKVKGNASVGAVTDLDGNFSISVPSENSILVFTYVGMKTKEVKIGKKREFKLTLEDDNAIGEVVVVGYGQQKKASVVGSITQTTGEVLERAAGVSDVGSALTGNLPGVVTIQGNGMPGEEEPQIIIRGSSSWNNSDPLVLVDGIERPLSSVDISSVESISVLKDASATAVYGVKGANGVILVTTKRGQEGKAKIDVGFNATLKAPSKLPNKYDSYDALMLRNQVVERELGIYPEGVSYLRPQSFIDNYRNQTTQEQRERYANVDWQDALFKKSAVSYNANVNVSGGTKFVKYFASADFVHEGDLFREYDNGRNYNSGYGYNRINVRSNLDFAITSSTTLKVNVAGSNGVRKAPWSNMSNSEWQIGQQWAGAYNIAPDVFLPQYSDGTWGFYPSASNVSNSAQNLAIGGTAQATTTRINTDFTLEQKLDFITKGLNFRGTISWDNVFVETGRGINDLNNEAQTKYIDPETGQVTYGKELEGNNKFDWQQGVNWSTEGGSVDNNQTVRNLYYQLQLNWARKFGQHDVSAMGLFSRQENARGSVMPTYREDWAFRATYSYAGRYNIEYNGAYNGSEKFSKDNRFAFFNSGAIGWTITEENFMKSLRDNHIIDMLKFRASYGEIGDDNIGDPFDSSRRWLYMSQWAYGGKTTMDLDHTDEIRATGFKGIIWVPGSGYQSNYVGYSKYPITDTENNFSYAVHVYSGWYGNMTDKSCDHNTFIKNFQAQVPMVTSKPIMVTEIDWSPEDPDKASEGHYNEWGQWIQPNLGSWATASTSKWGLAWKAVHDHFGNIGMTITHPQEYYDIDVYLKTGKVIPGFQNAKKHRLFEECCGYACMNWYKEWYLKQNTTEIKQLETQADVVSTLYYNIEGKEVEKPTAGVYIIKQLLSNGKIRSRKVFLK